MKKTFIILCAIITFLFIISLGELAPIRVWVENTFYDYYLGISILEEFWKFGFALIGVLLLQKTYNRKNISEALILSSFGFILGENVLYGLGGGLGLFLFRTITVPVIHLMSPVMMILTKSAWKGLLIGIIVHFLYNKGMTSFDVNINIVAPIMMLCSYITIVFIFYTQKND